MLKGSCVCAAAIDALDKVSGSNWRGCSPKALHAASKPLQADFGFDGVATDALLKVCGCEWGWCSPQAQKLGLHAAWGGHLAGWLP